MRKYITEKIGILEVFQIILNIVMLVLGYHAFADDVDWNTRVEEKGINVCIEINQGIKNETLLRDSICPQMSTLILPGNCDIEKYLTINPHPKQFWSILKEYLIRTQASQNTFLALITISAVVLVIHIIVANISKNLNVRTKWNAAMQGVILFGSGFALMLLAISSNAMDLKYSSFLGLGRFPECNLLMWCGQTFDTRSKQKKIALEAALEKIGACQAYALKAWSCILLGTMIFICLAMILMAMELTTKYEEEEEKEAIDKNARGEMDVLLQDENVNFETETAASDELLSGQLLSKNARFKRRNTIHEGGSPMFHESIRDKQHHEP